MNFEKRKTLVGKLQEVESNYAVDKWVIGDVHIWPVIKKIIFFYDFNDELKRKVRNPGTVSKILKYFYQIIKRFITILIYQNSKIKKSEFIFFGTSVYRIKRNGQSINRYFDPLIDFLKENYTLGEYKSLPKGKIYKKYRIAELTKFYGAFDKHRNLECAWAELMKSTDFDDFLKNETEQFGLLASGLFQEYLINHVNQIINWRNLFVWFLKKSQSKVAIGLCYYNIPMYGLNLAAKELNIPSVDMQHGTQGPLHVAYNIRKHPSKGYNLLPTVFWVWDHTTKSELEAILYSKSYKVMNTGNPSLSFFSTEGLTFNYDRLKPTILITVQPLPVVLPDFIYDTIAVTSNKYNWWIRLHPRMKQTQVDQINRKLEEFNILDEVEINKISFQPLVQILNEVDLHISRFSGSITEAAITGVRTIIIDELGINTYQELIQRELGYGYTASKSEELLNLISKLIEMKNENVNIAVSDYSKILKNLRYK